MAGLIGLTSQDIELQDALRATKWDYDGQWIPHPVVRLTTTLPIAIQKGGERPIVRARWGFPVSGGRPVGNARDDRLLESPMWKSMLGKSPCLVATTGVYEMVEVGGKKQSLWFRRQDHKPIVMPGLCAPRKMDEGEARLCCAIVTTAPNKLFGRFHDRQVCTLDGKELDKWMSATDPHEAVALLHTAKDGEWEAVPVDNEVFQKGRREMEHLREIGPVIRE